MFLMPSFRLLCGAAVAAAMMLTAAIPGHADIKSNALIGNALVANRLGDNALAATPLIASGSAIADLNGVTAQDIILPPETLR
jgi:hypothetical protein